MDTPKPQLTPEPISRSTTEEPTSTSITEERIVRRAASAYLRSREPEALDELETVFEPVYALLAEPEDETPAVRWEGGRLKASSSFVETTPGTSVIFIAHQLVQGLARGPGEEELAERLEKLAAQLAEYTEQPGRVEGIAAAVTEMTSELRLLRTAVSELGRRLEELVRSGAPPVDGVLLVEEELSGPKRALRYLFHAPVPGSRRSYDRYAVELLDQDPFTYFESQYGRIQDAPGHTPSHRRMARDELEGIGIALFDRLLPAELREALGVFGAGEHSAEEPVPSLYLVSTESWIPWELLKLRDAETGMPGPFLAEAVAVTRWLFGHEERWELPLREVAVVAPADSDLAEARAEAAGLRKILGDQHPITMIPAEYGAVTEELGRGRPDGWHFAGHAVAGDRENPDSGSLLLGVGEELTANALRARGAGLGATRPLVFLNACHSARGGPALTRVGGLAATFLELGAGAFLGTHWAVPDEPARLFAESFYRAFVAGLPLGEAVRQARLRVRNEHPDDPTWLAYAAFGHPAARCR